MYIGKCCIYILLQMDPSYIPSKTSHTLTPISWAEVQCSDPNSGLHVAGTEPSELLFLLRKSSSDDHRPIVW